jgi:predicted alpha/beta superfamily hydrolase
MKKITFLLLIAITFSCKQNTKVEVQKADSKIQFSEYTGKLASGTIKRIDSFPSKYVRPRTVDIWLPEGYSENEKYAVLYMHDGQMLFDANSTWNKQEWKIDEIMGQLQAENKIRKTIIVAMFNHSDIRHSDYYPQKPFEAIPQKIKDSIASYAKTQNKYLASNKMDSDNYLKFIVEEVKPVIDANFSVKTDAENTFVSGSSMGGLISMYAICEYPEIFGGAACLSTHWIGFVPFKNNPIPETFFSYLEQNIPSSKTHKIYFDYGTRTLDKFYLPYQHRVDEILKSKGYDEINSRNLKFEGDAHNEISWANRLDIPLTFLLGK